MAQTYHLHTCWQLQSVQRRAAQSAAERPSSLSTDMMRPGVNDVLLGSSRLINLANTADECHQNTVGCTDPPSGSILTCGCERLWLVVSYKLITCEITHASSSCLELVWLATLWLVLIIGCPPITARHSIIRWRMLLDAFIYCFPPALLHLHVGQWVRESILNIKTTLFSDSQHIFTSYDTNII